jgi:hypothetical protein
MLLLVTMRRCNRCAIREGGGGGGCVADDDSLGVIRVLLEAAHVQPCFIYMYI